MALQGTIDAFPLVDVLQLLSVSRKTGRLVIDGDRGRSSLWVADGALVAGEMPSTTPADPVEMVFEVLRFDDGSFLFEAGEEPGGDGFAGQLVDAAEIPGLLEGAGSLIEEWTAIVEVVPSTAHRVRPVPELPGVEVTIGADEWAAVVACGGGTHLASLAATLSIGDVEAARRVAGLVARGLVVVEEPAAGDLLPVPVDDGVASPAPPEEEVATADVPVDPLLADTDTDADEPFPERFPIDDLLGDGDESEAWGTTDGADRFAAAESYPDDAPAADEPTYVNPAFVDLGFGDYGTDAAADGAAPDGSHPAGAPADPAFSDGAFSDPAFSDPAFSDPAFSDPAFSDPAFSDPAFSDQGGQAFVDPGAAEPATAAFTDAAFSAPAPQATTAPGPAADAFGAPAPDGTDEVLRQMSKLSPKAAEAIAAALGTAAESDAEPPADGGSPFLQSF